MNRIILDCRGRLANQILCWANARHVLNELGITDRIIVINYPIPEGCVRFPEAVVEKVIWEHLPQVTRAELAAQKDDCAWIWDDVYFNMPVPEVLAETIRTIEFSDEFSMRIYDVIDSHAFIGIHARFGDFVSVNPANLPSSLPPFIRGSNDYFLTAMAMCRAAMPGAKFFLASDGTDSELEFLTRFPDVIRGGYPLFDMFALSRCRMIIGSASTFSSVAAQYGGIPWTVPTMTEAEINGMIQTSLQ